jgi:hypothetical protein
MSGRSWIVATAEQRAELRAVAGSDDREEADRARAILLSLDGCTGDRIALAFGVRPDSVRHWPTHHPLDPLAADGLTLGTQLGMGARRTLLLPMVSMNPLDITQEPTIGDPARGLSGRDRQAS